MLHFLQKCQKCHLGKSTSLESPGEVPPEVPTSVFPENTCFLKVL